MSIDSSQSLLPAQYGPTPPNVRLIRAMYKGLLGREPTGNGVEYWLSKVQEGGDLSEIVQGFTEAPEFKRKFGLRDRSNVGIEAMLLAFVTWSVKAARPSRYTIARYSMYRALRDALASKDASEHHCLSVSDSGFLAHEVGLRKASITHANYPKHTMTDLAHFKDGSFDSCVSDQVLEHVRGNPFKAISESLRIVKSGGLVVHTTCMMNEVHGVPEDFWRFSPDALRLMVADAGAEIVAAGGWGNRDAQMLINMGLRGVAVPDDPTHPFNEIALRNDPLWPITTWVIGRK